MEATIAKPTVENSPTMGPASAKRGRKPRQPAEEVARYFLAKEGSSLTRPELGDEAANESEALIKAFQSKGGVIYLVMSYRAEAEVQGGNPILVKRPLQK